MTDTSETPPLWIAAGEAAVRAALRAWHAIEPLYHGNYEITEKHDGPATEADRLADRLIVQDLEASAGGLGYAYLTEESEDQLARLERKHVWIIDPIDGTKDFIGRNGNFAIHIALAERMDEAASEPIWRPVAAAVYRPVAGHLYTAVLGRGAWRQSVATSTMGELTSGERERIHVTARGTLATMRSVVSNSHRESRLTRLVESLHLESFQHIGSLGIKLGLIAEGSSEIYVNLGLGKTKEWDTCAPHLILSEAGGMLTDLEGNAITYNRREVRQMRGLLATNGALHGEILGRVRAFIEEERRREAAAQP